MGGLSMLRKEFMKDYEFFAQEIMKIRDSRRQAQGQTKPIPQNA